jgi:hypothetical protein
MAPGFFAAVIKLDRFTPVNDLTPVSDRAIGDSVTASSRLRFLPQSGTLALLFGRFITDSGRAGNPASRMTAFRIPVLPRGGLGS